MRFLIQPPNFVGIFTLPGKRIFYFFIQIYTSSNGFPRRNFLIPTNTDFVWFFLSLRNLPPFCSTIRISLLSVGLEPWRRFRNSYCCQAKWFGGIFLDRGKYTVQNERCVAARYINVSVSAYSKKNQFRCIYKIPLFGEKCPIKKKRRNR